MEGAGAPSNNGKNRKSMGFASSIGRYFSRGKTNGNSTDADYSDSEGSVSSRSSAVAVTGINFLKMTITAVVEV